MIFSRYFEDIEPPNLKNILITASVLYGLTNIENIDVKRLYSFWKYKKVIDQVYPKPLLQLKKGNWGVSFCFSTETFNIQSGGNFFIFVKKNYLSFLKYKHYIITKFFEQYIIPCIQSQTSQDKISINISISNSNLEFLGCSLDFNKFIPYISSLSSDLRIETKLIPSDPYEPTKFDKTIDLKPYYCIAFISQTPKFYITISKHFCRFLLSSFDTTAYFDTCFEEIKSDTGMNTVNTKVFIAQFLKFFFLDINAKYVSKTMQSNPDIAKYLLKKQDQKISEKVYRKYIKQSSYASNLDFDKLTLDQFEEFLCFVTKFFSISFKVFILDKFWKTFSSSVVEEVDWNIYFDGLNEFIFSGELIPKNEPTNYYSIIDCKPISSTINKNEPASSYYSVCSTIIDLDTVPSTCSNHLNTVPSSYRQANPTSLDPSALNRNEKYEGIDFWFEENKNTTASNDPRILQRPSDDHEVFEGLDFLNETAFSNQNLSSPSSSSSSNPAIKFPLSKDRGFSDISDNEKEGDLEPIPLPNVREHKNKSKKSTVREETEFAIDSICKLANHIEKTEKISNPLSVHNIREHKTNSKKNSIEEETKFAIESICKSSSNIKKDEKKKQITEKTATESYNELKPLNQDDTELIENNDTKDQFFDAVKTSTIRHFSKKFSLIYCLIFFVNETFNLDNGFDSVKTSLLKYYSKDNDVYQNLLEYFQKQTLLKVSYLRYVLDYFSKLYNITIYLINPTIKPMTTRVYDATDKTVAKVLLFTKDNKDFSIIEPSAALSYYVDRHINQKASGKPLKRYYTHKEDPQVDEVVKKLKTSETLQSLNCDIINNTITSLIAPFEFYKKLRIAHYRRTLRILKSHNNLMNQLDEELKTSVQIGAAYMNHINLPIHSEEYKSNCLLITDLFKNAEKKIILCGRDVNKPVDDWIKDINAEIVNFQTYDQPEDVNEFKD